MMPFTNMKFEGLQSVPFGCVPGAVEPSLGLEGDDEKMPCYSTYWRHSGGAFQDHEVVRGLGIVDGR